MKTDKRKPAWLKVKAPGSEAYLKTRKIVKRLKLHTVCEEACCPNIGECWSNKTATFMILGEACTRNCGFCAITTSSDCPPPDRMEPEQTGRAVKELGLIHAVITSVTRDDLPDYGASHFAKAVKAIHKHAPECTIELLIPDLQGSEKALDTIIKSQINILNHNLETVKRLYPIARPQANYLRSLKVLKKARDIDSHIMTKSGIMVGLGEKEDEVLELMDDLRGHNVDILTIGQYLQPTAEELPVKEYITPEQFDIYKQEGLKRGFRFVESAPLIRSSYQAWKHCEPL